MPKTIKTRETVRDIKARSPMPPVGRQMKQAALRAKDTAAKQLEQPQGSPNDYTGDIIEGKTKELASGVAHTADSQGRKAVKQTYQRTQERIKRKSASYAPDTPGASSDLPGAQTPAESSVSEKAMQNQKRTPKKKQSPRQGKLRHAAAPEKAAAQSDRLNAPKQKAQAQKPGRKIGRAPKNAGTAAQGTQRGQQAAKSASKTAVNARQTAQHVRQATEQAVKRGKDAVKATWKVLKTTYEGTKALVMAIAAGGWIAVVIILVICMVGFIFVSPLGIFFSGEGKRGEQTIPQVVLELTNEYYDRFELLKHNHVHDVLDINGSMSLDWTAMLAVYAVQVNSDPLDPTEVVTMDKKKIDKLRKILYEMNNFTYSITSNAEHLRTLTVNVAVLSPAQMADLHRFNREQREQLDELLSPGYAALWAQLLGGYAPGSGEILRGDTAWIGTDILAWPMAAGDYDRISSGYGLRDDPKNPGTIKFHNGIDLAADEGKPILAAADGIVEVANSTDSWGYGWGYYVKIKHSSGFTTLYAHCSKIGVREDEEVHTGQVIGWVGNTGNSTGPHLHFSVYKNGVIANPLDFYASK